MSTFEIRSDGLIFSKHDTLDEADSELSKVRCETLIEIENLRYEIDEKQAFLQSLNIIARKSDEITERIKELENELETQGD